MEPITMTEELSLDDDEAFLRRLIFPEEDRHQFTATPWRGGYRWFRSPNVVCLERYRTVERKPSPRLKAS
jgi:hypothetical protein